MEYGGMPAYAGEPSANIGCAVIIPERTGSPPLYVHRVLTSYMQLRTMLAAFIHDSAIPLTDAKNVTAFFSEPIVFWANRQFTTVFVDGNTGLPPRYAKIITGFDVPELAPRT